MTGPNSLSKQERNPHFLLDCHLPSCLPRFTLHCNALRSLQPGQPWSSKAPWSKSKPNLLLETVLKHSRQKQSIKFFQDWSVTPFSGCNDVIQVLEPHVHQRSYWDGLALNFLLKRHLSKVEEKCVQCNQRWVVELSGSVGWQKLHLKAFGTKNLYPPTPTRSKPFTADNTVISGACRLGQRSLPLVSIYPHIHTFIPSFHPSIHPSIHTFYRPIQKIYPAILSRRLAKRWFSVWTQPDRTRCFLRVPLASKHLPHSEYTLKKYGFFLLWRKTLQNPTTSQL